MQNSEIITIDLSNHPIGAPLGMLLAPGALPPTPLVGCGSASSKSMYDAHGNSHQSNEKNHQVQQQNNYQNEAQYSRHVLVAGWEHSTLNSHLLGPIQRSGVVRLGDRLVRINHVDITDWTFREVMDALKEMISFESSATAGSSCRNKPRSGISRRKKRLKSLGFAPSNSEEWSRGVDTPEMGFQNHISLADYLFSSNSKNDHGGTNNQFIVHSKRLYSFASLIGGWRIVYPDATKHENGYENVNKNENEGGSVKIDSLGGPERFKENPASDLLSRVDDVQETGGSVHNEESEHQMIEDSTNAPPPPSSEQSKNDTNINTATKLKADENPFIQYEIECHLLFRDPQSFNTTNINSPDNSINGTNDLLFGKKTHHHKWSTWKRYSEFFALDTELRTTFGWQMNALHDGKGIAFPSSHDFESWWYSIRGRSGAQVQGDGSGKGYLFHFVGSGSSNDDGTKCMHENCNKMNRSSNSGSSDRERGMASGFLSYFRVGNSDAESTPMKRNYFTHSALNDNQQCLDNATPENSMKKNDDGYCPYPPSFMTKRQKELFNYWADLMKVEDIFEFSDVNSHRFGKIMAEFLGVDKILGEKSPSMSYFASSLTRTSVPVIYENETSGFDAAMSHHVFATPVMSGLTLRDLDDESTLSEDNFTIGFNGRVHTNGVSGNRKRVVDIVPNLETIDGAVSTSNSDNHILQDKEGVDTARAVDMTHGDDALYPRQSSSMISGAKRGQKGVKPAFQRQFLGP
ncbi:hypothetical protein ACHAXS_008193 [Conticribra weissflogii]